MGTILAVFFAAIAYHVNAILSSLNPYLHLGSPSTLDVKERDRLLTVHVFDVDNTGTACSNSVCHRKGGVAL